MTTSTSRPPLASTRLVWGPSVTDDARGELAHYTPRMPERDWARIRDFVVVVAESAAPATAYTAHRLAVILTSYVRWAHLTKGYPLTKSVLFDRKVINLYVREMSGTGQRSQGTLRNYRAMLERVAEVLTPELRVPRGPALNARENVRPYTSHELQQLHWWLQGQNTSLRAHRAAVLVSLGLGAGLKAREILALTFGQITDDEEGVVVHLPDRDVPVLAEWEPMLRRLLRGRKADESVFGLKPTDGNRNAISGFTRDVDSDVPIRVDRMRATWIVHHLTARTSMRALMTAAGVRKFENLAQLIVHVPELNNQEYRRQLRLQSRGMLPAEPEGRA